MTFTLKVLGNHSQNKMLNDCLPSIYRWIYSTHRHFIDFLIVSYVTLNLQPYVSKTWFDEIKSSMIKRTTQKLILAQYFDA